MIEINISTEGPCAKSFHCIAPSGRNQKNAAWARGKELFVADGRVFIQVRIAMPKLEEDQREYRKAIDMKKTYFMDYITGTLYFDDGRCMSTTQIKPRQFVRDDKLGVKILSERSTA
jgi:hypothetical protein